MSKEGKPANELKTICLKEVTTPERDHFCPNGVGHVLECVDISILESSVTQFVIFWLRVGGGWGGCTSLLELFY